MCVSVCVCECVCVHVCVSVCMCVCVCVWLSSYMHVPCLAYDCLTQFTLQPCMNRR